MAYEPIYGFWTEYQNAARIELIRQWRMKWIQID